MNVLDLFSGIGGFSLGLERAGMTTVAFCEIDPFCRRVLNKHWPKVPVYDDITTLTAQRLAADGIAHPDVLCGGFPCQDISVAGKGAGIGGARSRLWSEYARLVGELRPRYVIVENVSALLVRGLGRVLGDLSALGYDAEWHCISVGHIGGPIVRDRLWIIAYSKGSETRSAISDNSSLKIKNRRSVYAPSFGRCFSMFRRYKWDSEPELCRVVDGISPNVDRVAALGNAVVPQIPEIIGRAILAQEAELTR